MNLFIFRGGTQWEIDFKDNQEGMTASTSTIEKSEFPHEGPAKHIPTHEGISKNRGTPKSSILIGLSIINHPFCGTPI